MPLGWLRVLLACFLCPPSVRGHVQFINSNISVVCSRQLAFPGSGKPLVRTCMILFQVTTWLDKRLPLSRRDADAALKADYKRACMVAVSLMLVHM